LSCLLACTLQIMHASYSSGSFFRSVFGGVTDEGQCAAAAAAHTQTGLSLLWLFFATITITAVLCCAVLCAVLCACCCPVGVSALQSVRVATALNWQMVCGCVAASDPLGGTFDPVRYNSSYAAEFAQVRQQALPLAGAFKVCGPRTQQFHQMSSAVG
jgi:hypothetical protein